MSKMDSKEAKEIIAAGVAWANWTEKQKQAFKLTYCSIDKVEEQRNMLKEINDIKNEMHEEIERLKAELADMEGHKDQESDSKFEYMNRWYKALEENKNAREPKHIEEWDEDYGDCLWWSFPIVEPPYCGTPLDSDFPDYVTHFTRLILPTESKD